LGTLSSALSQIGNQFLSRQLKFDQLSARQVLVNVAMWTVLGG
jgi:hypothetical protein